MTWDKYVNERFGTNDTAFEFYEHPHTMGYIVKSKCNDQEYIVAIKEGGDNPYFYGDEIMGQGLNRFIYYKPAYSHYRIRNTQNGDEWEIPKKDTCISLCELLNSLALDIGGI